ncbi:hypothetical protein O181_093973 [Austropuccinia psidii MF-1]|uniref:Uncharacterized protein n=1 Tax=Austropuccinia psidii MF-1 TaxID=1389203 RepID=A0A9Q3J185_9BASI|nr:hypothetical protein [Austropuccinia psidii MF-1]
MGILILYCLNLPSQERFQPKHSCLAGLIPLPNQPDMITTNNILKPLADNLIQFNVVKTPTPNNSRQGKVVIQLVCLIGDMVATDKAAGFLSYSAKIFSSWCELQDNYRKELKLGEPQTQKQVLATSYSWNEVQNTKLLEKLAKEKCIQWPELNCLPYWDPVTNLLLGVVHSWYEGVLQYHLCYRLAFDSNSIHQQTVSPHTSDSRSNVIMEYNLASENIDHLQVKGYPSAYLIETISKRLKEVIVP